jgi:hypothetical protein
MAHARDCADRFAGDGGLSFSGHTRCLRDLRNLARADSVFLADNADFDKRFRKGGRDNDEQLQRQRQARREASHLPVTE